MKEKTEDFKKCCAEEIKRLCEQAGGSMNVCYYNGNCPDCGHFIGITQTPEKEYNEFLQKYKIEDINIPKHR